MAVSLTCVSFCFHLLLMNEYFLQIEVTSDQNCSLSGVFSMINECWLSLELHYKKISAHFNEPDWLLTGTCECGRLKKEKANETTHKVNSTWSDKNHLEPEVKKKMVLVTFVCVCVYVCFCGCMRGCVHARRGHQWAVYAVFYAIQVLILHLPPGCWLALRGYSAIIYYLQAWTPHLSRPALAAGSITLLCSRAHSFPKITFSVGSR